MRSEKILLCGSSLCNLLGHVNNSKQKGPLVRWFVSRTTGASPTKQSLRVLLRKTHLPLHKGGLSLVGYAVPPPFAGDGFKFVGVYGDPPYYTGDLGLWKSAVIRILWLGETFILNCCALLLFG